MKKLIIITVSVLLVGGGIFGYMKYQESQESTGRPFDPEWGKVNVKIGLFEDSVEFFNDVNTLTSEFDIDNLVFDMCLEASNLCSNPATFEPKLCRIKETERGDTIQLVVEFYASNAYGVSSKGTAVSDYINGEIINTIGF
jgi:hypothetical protein